MHDFPDTQASLLVNIRDPANERAWSVFSNLYRPVIYRMARRRGLQDADAQDLAQQVLVSVAGSVGNWSPDPDQPGFRHWLSRVTRNAIIDTFRKRNRKPDAAVGGSSVVRALNQSPTADETEIDHEYERALFRRAAALVQVEFAAETWAAFWQTTVEGMEIPVAARLLGRTPGSIYTARSRVMRRLQQVVEGLGK